MLDPGQIGALIPIVALTIPIVAIITGHRRKLAEMQIRARQQGDQRVLDEIAGLRRELIELRDTTTKYDLSFDTALQRMESRMAAAEQRLSAVEGGQTTVLRP